jgi:poly(A) polymerase
MNSQYYATQIVKTLVKAGFTAYFAGGWVRDFVMNHPSADVDIATNAPPQKILDLFPRTILVGLAFGVIIVVVEGHQFEVSTFRRDIDYQDGRKPSQIELSDAKEDASRRDFTINGMFFDPLEKQIIDYVGGIEDIKKKVIRAIGDPNERFVEDKLRMIRAARFSARFGFKIEEETQRGILVNADSLFPAVAKERVWQEFTKIFAFPKFDQAVMELYHLKLLGVIFPVLKNIPLQELKGRISPFNYFPKDSPTILYIMELFPYSSLEEQTEICNYLKLSKRDIQLVEYVYKMRTMINEENLVHKEPDFVGWVHVYAHPFYQTSLEIIAAREEEQARKDLLEKHEKRYKLFAAHIERIKAKCPLVNSAILEKHGIKPGKTMGLLIKEAEKIAILKNLHESDLIMSYLKNTDLWLTEGK